MGMCLHYSWTVLYCPNQTRWKASNHIIILNVISEAISPSSSSPPSFNTGNTIFLHDHLECYHRGDTCPFRPHRPRQSWSLWTRQGCRCCEASAGGQPLAADYNDDDDGDDTHKMISLDTLEARWIRKQTNKQKFTKSQIYKKRHKNWSHWTFWRWRSGGNSFHGSHWLVSVRV